MEAAFATSPSLEQRSEIVFPVVFVSFFVIPCMIIVWKYRDNKSFAQTEQVEN